MCIVLKTLAVFIASVFLFLSSANASTTHNTHVLIVYYSKTGHTQQLANAIAVGAKKIKHTAVRLVQLDKDKTSNKDLVWANAVIIGAPVYNANVAAPMLDYIQHWPFKANPLRNKIGAAFVTAGGMQAGAESSVLSLLRSMLLFQMIVVGGDTWTSPFGAIAVQESTDGIKHIRSKDYKISAYQLEKATRLGRRVALTAHKLA